jgi:type IV pilus assembly protein PilX
MAADRQQGMTLVMALVMTIAVLLIGISAAELAWQGEKAARAQRDRQVAFQAAEAALDDAETDIQRAMPDASRGLLARAQGDAKPLWQVVDLSGAEDGAGGSVAYGSFTGAAMETGQGFLPFMRPRYIVERMECHVPGEEASAGASPRYCYRVTAIGFGAQPETQVVLQSVFRRPD